MSELEAGKRPLNRDRRIKEMERAERKKERGEQPPTTKRFKDKTKYDRKRDRRKEHASMDVAKEIQAVARLLTAEVERYQFTMDFTFETDTYPDNKELKKWTDGYGVNIQSDLSEEYDLHRNNMLSSIDVIVGMKGKPQIEEIDEGLWKVEGDALVIVFFNVELPKQRTVEYFVRRGLAQK